MRIGMILDSSFPPDYRVEKEALTLIESGHKVLLFCLHDKKDFEQTEYKGILLKRYSTNKLEYKLSALAYTIPFFHGMMQPKIESFVQEFKPEVLHVHDMVIAEAAFHVAKRHHIPVVLDLHENRPASMAEYKHLQKFPGKYLINLKRWEEKQRELVKRADRVVVVTELAKADMIDQTRKYPDYVIVVPNTSSVNFGQNPLDEGILARMKGTFNLLYIGDTSIRRGTSDAIAALSIIKQKIPSIKLWIIGKSSADEELKQLVADKNLTDQVQFEGFQPEKLFNSYITGTQVCISPLRRNRHHDTTFANKIFQYMSIGRPVVVSDCTAQARVVVDENCGLVHTAGDLQSFADAIIRLHDSPQLRETMGINARKAVQEKWNWEKTSVPLVDLYQAFK